MTPIIWAQENGIVYGRDETHFAPDESITRQDFVTILYRLEAPAAVDYDLSRFTDAGKISDYAAPAMRWAVENHIIYGRSDTELAPREKITRAEMITMLLRYDAMKNAE